MPDLTEPWEFGDKIFVVQGKKIYANKTILSMASDVFKAMLAGDFQEKTAQHILLPGKRYDEILTLFSLIHTLGTASMECKFCLPFSFVK